MGMSAERLREMLSEATPGPWEVTDFGDGKPKKYVKLHFGGGHSFTTLVHSYENARLIAIAPDAIALLADFAEAAESSWPDIARVRMDALLTRLDALCGDER